MDSNHRIELLNVAIQRVIEEKKIKDASGDTFMPMEDNVDDQLLLSGLLSQLESLKGDGLIEEPEGSTEIEEVSSGEVDNVETKVENADEVDGGSSVGIGTEEIVKELKKVKKQNFVTHCLLSVMIVLTLAWQVSEVSLIWKIKNGLTRPFRSFGGMFSWILKGPDADGQDAEKQFSVAKQRLTKAAASLPSVIIPEIPLGDLPDLVLDGEHQ
ncbi:hypothetical protein FH972_009377 [Carpinus fangiana]|uniref:Uncharacterized protein n=1 Tax=Carpinus fangiana TaxID=176857 RepID=A0A5N6R1S9_9ROSI|nr:hypothetical protein FH972_009377 [Carpinus fangiana]